MTATTARFPSPLRSWFTGGVLAILAFGACWAGAIMYWRARGADPGAVELMVWLLVLPGAMLTAALVARARLSGAAPAGARVPARASQAAQVAASLPEAQPLAILAAAVRSPYGASCEEVVAALGEKKAKPALDGEFVDDDGFPLMTARCADEDASVRSAIGAWFATNAITVQFSDEQWRALAMATGVAVELAGHAARADDPDAVLRLAPVLPADWSAGQCDAAGKWLRHTVAQSGWPLERIVIIPASEADRFTMVPTTLLAQLATRLADAPVTGIVLACASHLGVTSLRDWENAQSLFTSRRPDGKIPGEGAVGLLLTDLAWARTKANEGAVFAVLEPIHGARRPASADAHRGPPPSTLAGVAASALGAAHLDPATLAMIVADTGPRTSRMLELLGYAGSDAQQLDDQKEVLSFGHASGVCGAVPALTALALAAHYAGIAPVLWLSNEDPFQCCAAIVRPPAVSSSQ